MDNTWYYTLSTIVQTLGSIFGLGGTFLVFKLQTLEKELRDYRNKGTRILMYLERKPEDEYDPLSLIDLSNAFLKKITDLVSKDGLGLSGTDYGNMRNIWGVSTEDLMLGGEDENVLKNRTLFSFNRRSKEFNNKVYYRLKLYKWALVTGIILAVTMIIGLLMLASSSYFSNLLGHTPSYWIYWIITFACIGIISVIITAFYAIWGDKY